MIKNKYLAFGLFIIIFVLFENLLDFLYSVFIIRSAYTFSVSVNLTAPLTIGAVVGYIIFLRKK